MMEILVDVGDKVSYFHPWDNEPHIGTVEGITPEAMIIEEQPIGAHTGGVHSRTIKFGDLSRYHLNQIEPEEYEEILNSHRRSIFERVKLVRTEWANANPLWNFELIP